MTKTNELKFLHERLILDTGKKFPVLRLKKHCSLFPAETLGYLVSLRKDDKLLYGMTPVQLD